ncbi:hypothetical protein [uncultured Massilia sp.]|uniref:hypothetical protein n=1 Tax=uncultured Massilia sp. TaxID=169973 RepID=UPI002589B71A|nr:hypothetical protein [uncultured Massilia sp.]
MKKQVVHVSVLQSAKVMAVLYLVLSIPMVAIMAIPAMMGTERAAAGMTLGMLVLMPILYTVLGFIFTAIGAWVYNLVAARVGGFEFTTTESSN